MTTSLVRKQPRTAASTPAAPSSAAVDVAPAVQDVAFVAEPVRPSVLRALVGVRLRSRRAERAESAASDSIVAIVAERAQSRADARYRNDEGGADDDGGWG